MWKKVIVQLLIIFSYCFSVIEFGYKFTPEKDVYLITEKNNFFIQPQSIISNGNMLYFAAQDFTKNRELIVKKQKKLKL